MNLTTFSSSTRLYHNPPTLKYDPTITPQDMTLSSLIFSKVTPEPTRTGKSLVASHTSCTDSNEGGRPVLEPVTISPSLLKN